MIDTNILLYAALGEDEAPEKKQAARQIVATRNYSTSAQVLAEFYTNAINTKKWEAPLSPEAAAKWVAVLSAKPCIDVDSGIVMRGIEASITYKLSYWDGAILAAAERLGVSILYSEDMNHGQIYGKVRVCNPFKEDFLAFQ